MEDEVNAADSPEWETADERTVKWDREQTEYLRKRPASVEEGGEHRWGLAEDER